MFEWDQEKNRRLNRERGISFEAVLSRIEAGAILAIVPGRGRYAHQKQFLIELNGYVHVVPYVEQAGRIFLKTIIPSRKLTRKFLKEVRDEEP